VGLQRSQDGRADAEKAKEAQQEKEQEKHQRSIQASTAAAPTRRQLTLCSIDSFVTTSDPGQPTTTTIITTP
jgi:hypothetical protein